MDADARQGDRQAMTTIAGHTFEDTPSGRACSYCGKLWVDVAIGAYLPVGASGISHTGTMSETEKKEIEAEVDRIWMAVAKVSG